MFEAFECFVCRQVLAFFGADSSRCPGCGSVHGKVIRRAHVNAASVKRRRTRRSRLSVKRK